MTTAILTPGTTRDGATGRGAGDSPHHRVGNVLRAVRVFASAVFSVAVLGEYAEEAGVRRR
ncbi:hypothetical protein GLX30_19720 [Streptomyces sp. Tu 2975]|uniref:hypothetical protein n=1 Tax=Streptomyces sp. Tu 2975 TaxID=2676871 RepID=UPI00135AE3A7|nr:hypothetical protein [Streptomyces sp. Tu 2975]QIP85888.1 hypothetical protein GLX30_19720 [Streptomyces sp. Tu 2975]